MILAAFLGTGNYVSAVYSVENDDWRSHEVRYVQCATAQYLEELRGGVDEVIIFATDAARDAHAKGIQGEFLQYLPKVPLKLVTVPNGFNELEAIEIFEKLQEELRRVSSDAKGVAWDLTHGFRIQPTMALLVLNYLRRLPAPIEVHDIFYGAWERGAEKDSPLVSVRTVWELNDWAEAFSNFERQGRTQQLTTLLESKRNAHGRHVAGLEREERKYTTLPKLLKALQDWEEAVQSNQILQLIGPEQIVSRLYTELEADWDELTSDVARFAKPFRAAMAKSVGDMRTDQQWWEPDGLRAQFSLMRWLYRYERHTNVATIAREWFVTVFQWVLNCPEDRARADRVLGGISYLDQGEQSVDEQLRTDVNLIETRLAGMGYEGNIRPVVSKTVDLRNTLNHAGMPRQSVRDEDIGTVHSARQLEQILTEIGKIVRVLR